VSFQVSSYNMDSGWKVGEFLSEAATESEALAEAATRLGDGPFRHVAVEVQETPDVPEPPASSSLLATAVSPVQPELSKWVETAPVQPADTADVMQAESGGHADAAPPVMDEADDIASLLRTIEPTLLQRAISKLKGL
jgi:hypothetical protein